MHSFIETANELFGSTTPTFCEEVLYHFTVKYHLNKECMPSQDSVLALMCSIQERDCMEVLFDSESDQSIRIDSNGSWEDDYKSFLDDLLEDETVEATVKITKKIVDSTISIYCMELFSNYFVGKTIIDYLSVFDELFKESGEHIWFNVLDRDGILATSSIMFSNVCLSQNTSRPRAEMLKDCNAAGVFLQRSQYAVIPQDFTIQQSTSDFEEIEAVFNKLRNALAFIYIANTANIVDQKVIAQFEPTSTGYEYELEQVIRNQTIPAIFDWAFADDKCIDKATIVRKIISIYCHSKEDVLAIDDKVLNSIKSNYVIYQKNNAEKYIELKNKISEFIVSCMKQVQDISHELTDAFRNNFVAIIVFTMTVLLTDTIDIEEIIGAEVSLNISWVCGIFTIATFMYLVVTIVVTYIKWKWIKNSYEDLKANYKGVLDENDINVVVRNDAPIERTRKQLLRIATIVSILWLGLVFALGCFTASLNPKQTTPACMNEKAVQESYDQGADFRCDDVEEDAQ